MTRRLFLVLACLIVAAAQASAQSKTTLVILVRHAEKAANPAADPSLTEAGFARARALAAALANTNVQAVITTELVRTRETARPFAESRRLTPEIVHTGARDAHASAVADAVRAHAGQAVLVVGHSNTIPAIIAALGGPKLPDICDTQYSNLFVLLVGEGRADLVVSSYGAPSVDPLMTCPSSLR
ncbi:MAG: SixA phosphatase family protein [Gemmatimonadales bacterium]